MRILLVEDEADLRLSLGLALRVAGHEVDEAVSGRQALGALSDVGSLPDAVLLDLRLPDTDGWEVLEDLGARGLLPGLPVIVGSADADPAARQRALAAGCIGYLVKPFEPQQLLRLLERST